MASSSLSLSTRWLLKPWRDLTPAELYAMLALRADVFVVEQQCAYQDVDGRDMQGVAHHLMAWEGDRLDGCLRLLRDEDTTVIGRVVVRAESRGRGLGHALMRAALAAASELWPGDAVRLSAQAHLQGFYRGHGFATFTEPYLEDGIPHVGMRRDAEPPAT